MSAWRNLQRLKRERLRLYEMPIAVLTTLMANINRDSEKWPEPFVMQDFLLFADKEKAAKGRLSPATAEAMLDLRRRRLLPDHMIAAWSEVLKSAQKGTRLPDCKAMASRCGGVWLINPRRERDGFRCGLVGIHGVIRGRVVVSDVDRPLISHTVEIPARNAAGWMAHDLWVQVC